MAKKLWGGRFTKATDKTVEEFTESISYDCRLIEHDIRGSIAHATMLGACEIIDLEESHQIVKGLTSILEDYQAGQIEFDTSAEDIHMNVEQLLFERIGDERLGLEWEPCHQIEAFVDPIAQLGRWKERIHHIHGKDAAVEPTWMYSRRPVRQATLP